MPKLSLPEDVLFRINKFLSSPSRFKEHIPVSTRNWYDYDTCLHVHTKYKLLCYINNTQPMMFMVEWSSYEYELFLYVYQHISI